MEQILEKINTPASSVNVEEFESFIHDMKEHVKDCDSDLKDAKRRISVAKGPRKKRNRFESAAHPDSGSEAGSVSD